MISKRKIFVTFSREGVHRYPDAPEEVKFLRHPHRHIFHFTAWIDVYHNDRDVEFILFKRELEAQYANSVLEMDHKSCEMLAEDLIDYISGAYPDRKISVIVSEDGENGAQLDYEPD